MSVMMLKNLRLGVVAIVVFIILFLTACGESIDQSGSGQAFVSRDAAEPVVTPASTRTSVPIEQNPVIPPGEPVLYEITSHIDQPPTPELLADFSNLVIVGVVREHLEPRWSTPAGRRPEMILQGDPTRTIFTPVVIDLEQPPLMDLEGSVGEATAIVAFIEGGTIDEVTVRHTGSFYALSEGDRVVLGALSTVDPWIASVYGDVFSRMLPNGFDVGWLPQARFVIDAGVVSSDGERFPEDEFFSRPESTIEDRLARSESISEQTRYD